MNSCYKPFPFSFAYFHAIFGKTQYFIVITNSNKQTSVNVYQPPATTNNHSLAHFYDPVRKTSVSEKDPRKINPSDWHFSLLKTTSLRGHAPIWIHGSEAPGPTCRAAAPSLPLSSSAASAPSTAAVP